LDPAGFTEGVVALAGAAGGLAPAAFVAGGFDATGLAAAAGFAPAGGFAAAAAGLPAAAVCAGCLFLLRSG
jgi:hypothetical protein